MLDPLQNRKVICRFTSGKLNFLEGHFEDQKQRSKAKNILDYFPFTDDIKWLSWSDPKPLVSIKKMVREIFLQQTHHVLLQVILGSDQANLK